MSNETLQDAPLVSVITACHNAEPFVGETIESVLAQTYPSVEHILVDDASTDGSWSVLERYAAAHGRVRALGLESNRGGSHARNRGVELARGEFLMFLDADDLVSPDALASLVDAARDRAGSIAVCDCELLRQDAGGSWRAEERDVPELTEHGDVFRAWLENTAWPPTCSVLWRRDAYELTGGWGEEMARDQDTDIMLRAFAAGVSFVEARGGVGYYRLFDGSRGTVSSGTSPAKLQSSMRVLEKITAEIERQGRIAPYRHSIGVYYHQLALQQFQAGYPELGRESLRRGEGFAGRHVVSWTPLGRFLERTLGMERKERVVRGLARLRIMTPSRRRNVGVQFSRGRAGAS